MPRYMLILHEYDGGFQQMTPQESQEVIEHFWRWTNELNEKGINRGGESLEYPRMMVKKVDGEIVTDGPYTETKEIIGGYYIVEAADFAAAAEIAKGSPVLLYGGAVEVREVTEWE